MKRTVWTVAVALMLAACNGRDDGGNLTPAETALGRGLTADPELGDGYAALARAYPNVWRDFLAKGAAAPKTGNGAARALGYLEERLAPATPGLIIAPDAELGALLQARLDVLEALKAHGAESCAAYFSFLRTPDGADMPVRVRTALHRQRAAYFRALAAAIESPVERPPYSQAEEAQVKDVARDVERDLGSPLAVARDSSAEKKCQFALAYYETLSRTSPSLGGRLFADDVLDDWQDKTKFPAGI